MRGESRYWRRTKSDVIDKMKITMERASLLKALNHVQSVVERRNTIPILANVLLQAEDGQLGLTATDLDIEVIESVDAEILQPGATTVSAHTLYDIVRKIPDGAQLSLEYASGDARLNLTAGRSRFALQCLPREDFPVMASGDMPQRFAVDSADLARLIEKTRFAVSTEETRYYLNGIYLHAAEMGGIPMLRVVATDGHRLASVELPLPEGAAGMPGVIVPRKTVNELHKLVEDQDGLVEVAVSDSKIHFGLGRVSVTSKLIDGTFPDYERVIPRENDKLLALRTAEFSEAVDRVSTISTEKSRAVKLNLESAKMTLSANNPDSGSATEELAVDYAFEPIEIGFNARYLMDILGQIDGENVQLMLADSGSPTLVRDLDDERALYVLMPMRV